MARFIVTRDDRVLKDCVVGPMATIGRHSDNAIVIDDPAASGHHACVFRDGEDDVLKDLGSTNGTFINERRVSRHVLRSGDVIGIGSHRLTFKRTKGDAPAAQATADALMSNPGETIFLDADKHQALLAMLRDEGSDAVAPDAASPPVAAVLHVVDGGPSDGEYALDAETSIIGRSDTALLRLDGWFAPKIAIAIARTGEGYVATAMGGRTLINRQPFKGRCRLQHGDLLEVKGRLTVEFRQAG